MGLSGSPVFAFDRGPRRNRFGHRSAKGVSEGGAFVGDVSFGVALGPQAGMFCAMHQARRDGPALCRRQGRPRVTRTGANGRISTSEGGARFFAPVTARPQRLLKRGKSLPHFWYIPVPRTGRDITKQRLSMRKARPPSLQIGGCLCVVLNPTPLYRASVGFDQMADLLNRVMTTDVQTPSYPPYNIEKTAEKRLSDFACRGRFPGR